MALSEEATRKIQLEIIRRAVTHPIDFLWREHFNIPYGSKEHLEVSFIDQQKWFEESRLFELIREEKNISKGIDKYMGENNLKTKEDGELHLSESKIDEKFENLDLSKFKDEHK